MANMREIRTRIDSVKDTMKITNAMYLISSSKLRKARSGRDAVSPYFESLQATISDILDRSPDLEGTLFDASSMKEKESEDDYCPLRLHDAGADGGREDQKELSLCGSDLRDPQHL